MVEGVAAGLDDGLAARVVHSTDNSIYQVLPAAVATPRSADDVAALLAANDRDAAPQPITARGGATGTNGQSLTDGVVIDVKRHLHRIRSVDPSAQIAVVEPGVVAMRLDRELEPHGLRWAPHTSTVNRATVGGMVSTDAAGKGSLVHGRAHRHVAALDLCLADGTIVHLAPTAADEAHRLAGRSDRVGRLWSSLLELPRREPGSIGPRLGRSWTGYGLDRLWHDGVIDPTQLVVGAEGTLGVITALWLRLTPRPASTTMVVAAYDSFDDALRASLDLAATAPTAIETFDETTLDAARSSRSWPALAPVVGEGSGAVLVLEYDGAEHAPERLAADVDAAGRARRVAAVTDEVRRRDIWTVRADAVGLLARSTVAGSTSTGSPTLARPVSMVEDCAVPIEQLPHFIADFRRLLDDAGLHYGMFGHADVGCVHVRPALDLTDPAHERLVGDLTERVVALVEEHGGVLWGEHGRGMRSAVVERVLDPATLELMRRVKTAFDPDDRCNPGALYRPLGVDRPVLGPTDAPLRGVVDRRIPVGIRAAHASAFACNGNGLCHDVEAAAPMCPSYQATGDPARSPKGRADLLRAWLALTAADTTADVTVATGHDPLAQLGPIDGELAGFEDQIAENLDECLSCAACTGRCPVSVDVPELKSRFLDAYFTDRRRPIGHRVLGTLERLAPLAARAPWLATASAPLLARTVGLTDLPTPTGRRRRPPAPAFDPTDPTGVVLVPDVFTSVLEPATTDAAVAVLRAAGIDVSIAPLLASGKYDHVIGRRDAYARAARRRHELLRSIEASGATPVTIEPAVTVLHRHDDTAVVDDPDRGRPDTLAETLAASGASVPPVDTPTTVTVLGHCSERALEPDEIRHWANLLTAAGHTVDMVDVGCCGMAGGFGHQRRHQEMSHDLWQRNWADAVTDAPGVVTATGWSCRSQARRFGDRPILHPVELLVGTVLPDGTH